jgi:hypothetical protein
MRYPVTCPAPTEREVAEWQCRHQLQLGLQEVATEIETEQAKAIKAIMATRLLAAAEWRGC